MTMLEATAICSGCGFAVPPGAEHLTQVIGVDTLIGTMIPGKTLLCPVCGEAFTWRDPEERKGPLYKMESFLRRNARYTGGEEDPDG